MPSCNEVEHLLAIPNLRRILLNTPIGTEKPHPRHRRNRLSQPLLLLRKNLVNQLLRIHVTLEIIRNQIIIPMVHYTVHQRAKLSCVAESATADRAEDLLELGVEVEFAVEVGVTEVFDIFGEVAEQEDVVFANFAGDLDGRGLAAVVVMDIGETKERKSNTHFDVGTVAGANDEATVEDELGFKSAMIA